jgi:hypothetical protein
MEKVKRQDLFFNLLPFTFYLLPFKDLGFATQDHSWCAFIGEMSARALLRVGRSTQAQNRTDR